MSEYDEKVARLEKLKRLKELRTMKTGRNPADFQLAEEKPKGKGLDIPWWMPPALGIAGTMQNFANIPKRIFGGEQTNVPQDVDMALRPSMSTGQNIAAGAGGLLPYTVPVAGQAAFIADLLTQPKEIPTMAKEMAKSSATTKKAIYGKGLENTLANIFTPFKGGDPEAQETLRQTPVESAVNVGMLIGGPKLLKSGAKKIKTGIKNVKAITDLAKPKPAEPPILKETPKTIKPKPEVKETITKPPPKAPPAKGKGGGSYDKFLDRAVRKATLEERGRDVLDAMSEKGVKPSEINSQFWKDVYPKLSPESKIKFEKYIKRVTGFEPGSVMFVERGGKVSKDGRAKDWQDIGLRGLEPASKAGHLEGSERGLIVLEAVALEQFRTLQKGKGGLVKQLPDLAKPKPVEGKGLTSQQKAKLERFGVVKKDKVIEPPPPEKPVKPKEKVPEGGEIRGLKKEDNILLRERYDLEKIPEPQREAQTASLQKAKDIEMDVRALDISREVLDPRNPRKTFTTVEEGGVVLRSVQVENQYKESLKTQKRLEAEGNKAGAKIEEATGERLLSELDELSRAYDKAGTEWGRSGAFRKVRIDPSDYSIAKLKTEISEKKGRKLTSKESADLERMVVQRDKLQTQLDEALSKNDKLTADMEKSVAEKVAKIEAGRVRIRKVIGEKKVKLAAERENIKKQLRGLGMRVNEGLGLSAEGSYLVGKLAVNYIRTGTTTLEGVVKQVLNDMPQLRERDVWQALNARQPKIIDKAKKATQKRISEIKTQGRLLDELADVTQGVFGEKKPSTSQMSDRVRILRRKISEIDKRQKALTQVTDAKKGVLPKVKKQKQPSKELQDLRKELHETLTRQKLQEKLGQAKKGIFDKPKKKVPVPEDIAKIRKQIRKLRALAERTAPTDKRLQRLRDTFSDLQKQLSQHSRDIKKKRAPDPAAIAEIKEKIALIRKEMRMEDTLADLNKQLQTGEFKNIPKQRRPLPPHLERMQMELLATRKRVRSAVAEAKPWTFGRVLSETIHSPRSLQTTGEHSGVLRQGLLPTIQLLYTNPSAIPRSLKRSLVAPFNPKRAELYDKQLRSDPYHYLREKSKLDITEIDGLPTKREEMFRSRLVEKIPVLGTVLRASNRAMTTYLNEVRAAVFDNYAKKYPNATPQELTRWANFTNIMSGRGNMGRFQAALTPLSVIGYAPKFTISRIQYPFMGLKDIRTPRVRKEIAYNYARVAATGLAMIGLQKLAGADVGTEPDNSDWGKGVFGNTRIDVWGGLQQPMRVFIRIALGLTDKFGLTEGDREDLLDYSLRSLTYKLSPAVTLPLEVYRGKSLVGEEASITETSLRAVAPLMVQDIRDAWKLEGPLQAGGVAGATFFGIGANTYERGGGRASRTSRKPER